MAHCYPKLGLLGIRLRAWGAGQDPPGGDLELQPKHARNGRSLSGDEGYQGKGTLGAQQSSEDGEPFNIKIGAVTLLCREGYNCPKPLVPK